MKPVAFAHRSLSPTEHRYANNECEPLAVLTGLKRFHYHIYSMTIHVITDYQSWVNVFQKDLAEMPARFQRTVYQIHQYDVVLHYRKASLCSCQIVYQETLSMRKNVGSDLEDLDTRLGVAGIDVSTYVPQSALEEIRKIQNLMPC